jgi:hypothetical protein
MSVTGPRKICLQAGHIENAAYRLTGKAFKSFSQKGMMDKFLQLIQGA